jgi:hypothetical protein
VPLASTLLVTVDDDDDDDAARALFVVNGARAFSDRFVINCSRSSSTSSDESADWNELSASILALLVLIVFFEK